MPEQIDTGLTGRYESTTYVPRHPAVHSRQSPSGLNTEWVHAVEQHVVSRLAASASAGREFG